MRHHTQAEIDECSAQYPGFWICELVTVNATCLLAIPPTKENGELELSFAPHITGDMLNGASIALPR